MSEQNHEERIAELEKAVNLLQEIQQSTTRTIASIAKHNLNIRDAQLQTLSLLLKIHPKLSTNETVGALHAGLTQTEFDRDSLSRLPDPGSSQETPPES